MHKPTKSSLLPDAPSEPDSLAQALTSPLGPRTDSDAAARPVTQRQSLEKSIRSLGGIWNTRRAVTALADAGHVVADKRARQLLRDLAEVRLLQKIEPVSATYRTVE